MFDCTLLLLWLSKSLFWLCHYLYSVFHGSHSQMGFLQSLSLSTQFKVSSPLISWLHSWCFYCEGGENSLPPPASLFRPPAWLRVCESGSGEKITGRANPETGKNPRSSHPSDFIISSSSPVSVEAEALDSPPSSSRCSSRPSPDQNRTSSVARLATGS